MSIRGKALEDDALSTGSGDLFRLPIFSLNNGLHNLQRLDKEKQIMKIK